MRISEFRSQAKIMLAIVVVAFVGLIFFQWGMNITTKIRGQVPRDVIGKVGNQEIKVGEYNQAVNQILQQIPGSPNAQLIDSIRNQTWQDLVADRIYSQLMAKEGLHITSDEIKEIIKNSPPPEIAQMPEMRNEKGEFDFQKYHQLLRDRRNINWILDYEFRIRKEYPKRKVNIALATAGWVTPGEVEILSKVFAVRFTGLILSFPAAKYTSQVDTSNEALLAYYHQHISDWKKPERRQCQYVFFPKIPARDDTNDLQRRSEDLEEDLKTDVEFHALAAEYTNDPKIDLSINDLSNDIKKKVKKSRIGAITRIDQGHRFIYIKRTKKDSIQRIVLEVVVSSQTIYDIYDRMASFVSTAKDIGFEKTCEQFGFKPYLTYPFEEKSVNFAQLRDPMQLARFAFRAKLNDLSDPLVGKGGYYIFYLYTISPAAILSFAKISHYLKSKYIRERSREIARQKASEVYQRFRSGEGISKILKDYPGVEKIQISSEPLHKLKTIYGAELVGAILALKPKELSEPIQSTWAVYIPVLERLDQKNIKESANYVNRLRQLRAQFIFKKTLESFDIKDFRSYETE